MNETTLPQEKTPKKTIHTLSRKDIPGPSDKGEIDYKHPLFSLSFIKGTLCSFGGRDFNKKRKICF